MSGRTDDIPWWMFVVLLFVLLLIIGVIRSCTDRACEDKGGTAVHPSGMDPNASLCVGADGRIIP